jgi:Protein of unknown function (DUF2490)
VGRRSSLIASLCAGLLVAPQASAADATEFWPELSAFVELNPTTRLYLDASYVRGEDFRSLDLSGFVDISIKPILRPDLWTDDWQRKRYLWARLGYTRVLKAVDGGSTQVTEDRAVVSGYWRAELPAEVWLESRARADLRWMRGDYSTRYRLRLEVNREFTVLEHAVLPYFNAEAFYDTRYDGWARALYQGGAEVTVDKHFRYEIFLASQIDRLPARVNVGALGVVAKWYY